jgi:hypothetical protein
LRRVSPGRIKETHAEVRGGLATDGEVILFPSENAADGFHPVRRAG